MTFTRKHLAILAAVLIAILAIGAIWYVGQQGAHDAATKGAASASASATASADSEDTSTEPAASDAAAPTVPVVPASAISRPAGELKAIHSPDKVAIDETLSPGQCKVRAVDAAAGLYLPDQLCTPGAIDPAVSEENIGSTICKSGYTITVRAPAADTDKAKALSMTQYGQTRASSTEYDHLISLQLGGTNSVSNLWPEPNRAGAPGTTNPKDAIETRLNKAVCSHKVTLAAAQKAIATNWVTAEKDLGL